MSIISSRSAKSREGFTPYQSQEGDLREISLFSRLNLNDHVELDREIPHQIVCNKSASDLLSIGSKKRKLSEELMNTSKIGGNKTFLNRSLIGKSSLNGELLIEMDSSSYPKKELSENSCPVVMNNEQHMDPFSQPEMQIEDRPRFTKTKNLLRNISNYMHKFILYNKRAEKWIRRYFNVKANRRIRKLSTEKSQSNSQPPFTDTVREDSNSSPQAKEYPEPTPIRIEEPQMKEEQGEEANDIEQQVSEFLSWVGQQSIGNFSDYEGIWTRPHKFRSLYRTICYKYYRNQAYCDIMRSRLTTKDISVQYLVQFIEGILQPAQFYRFK